MFFKSLKLELLLNRKGFLFAFAGTFSLFAFLAFSLYAGVYRNNLPQQRVLPGFWDMLCYAHEGILPFSGDRLDSFILPINQILMYLILMLAVGGTTRKSLTPYGYEIFTRLPNRRVWWLTRCVWCVIVVVGYWLACLAGVTVVCLGAGGSFAITDYLALVVPAIVPWPGEGSMQVITVLFTPLLVLCATVLMQQLLELILGDFWGFLLTLAFVVSGAFLDLPLLFANHIMLVRSAEFLQLGTTFGQTLLYTISMGAACLVGGCFAIRKKDLL